MIPRVRRDGGARTRGRCPEKALTSKRVRIFNDHDTPCRAGRVFSLSYPEVAQYAQHEVHGRGSVSMRSKSTSRFCSITCRHDNVPKATALIILPENRVAVPPGGQETRVQKRYLLAPNTGSPRPHMFPEPSRTVGCG